LKEIVSHFPMTYYKNSWVISKFPETERVWKVIKAKDFAKNCENLVISISDLWNYEAFDSSWNWKINPEILKKVVKDDSWNYYRIVEIEYDFLVKHWLPLPRLHWLDRIKVNFGV